MVRGSGAPQEVIWLLNLGRVLSLCLALLPTPGLCCPDSGLWPPGTVPPPRGPKAAYGSGKENSLHDPH